MKSTKWIKSASAPDDFRGVLAEYPGFFADLCWQRGLRDREAVERFLHPDYDRDLRDPAGIKNIETAAYRIEQAIKQGEHIVIYSDYDADGVCASAILHEFLESAGAAHGIYMPDRHTEGYGFHPAAVDAMISQGANLIVTLDCGTTSHEAVARARDAGIDVIVVDHHQVVGGLPLAYTVVNPHQEGDTYPFKGLCGGGLAFKLVQVLSRGVWADGREKWLLDLAAIATVADMMPLVDENRTLVSYGLFVLAHMKRPGIRELFRVARVNPTLDHERYATNITASTIGFSIGPRINAASRMAHAELAYRVLTTKDPVRARILALELESLNDRRRKEIEFVESQIRERLDSAALPHFIVESSPDWPAATAGLIAGRIKDAFGRPVMLAQVQGEKAKASLRGPDGFNLLAALEHASDYLIQYGGHEAAAGCSMRVEHIPALAEALNEYASRVLKDADISKLEISATLTLEDVTGENAELVERLSPFGMGNAIPRFLVRSATLERMRPIGKGGRHAELFVRTADDIRRVLFFGHNGEVGRLTPGEQYDIVGELSLNEWNGRREPQFKVIEIKNTHDKRQ